MAASAMMIPKVAATMCMEFLMVDLALILGVASVGGPCA
jgi:hypothetical protein